jgi:hypothetical protein
MHLMTCGSLVLLFSCVVCVCNICVFVLQPRVAKILGGANLLPAHLNFRNSAPKEGSLKKAEKKAERAAKAPA